jgi:hypothetical protein
MRDIIKKIEKQRWTRDDKPGSFWTYIENEKQRKAFISLSQNDAFVMIAPPDLSNKYCVMAARSTLSAYLEKVDFPNSVIIIDIGKAILEAEG